MSIHSSSKKKPGRLEHRPAYLRTFIKHVHHLILAGYRRVAPLEQRDTDERVITQRIVREINATIKEDGAPKWMERYHATPDRPMDIEGKEGASAKRVDIEFILCKGDRPLFHFECKRLGKSNPVRDYLGDEGLGCFLTEQYARGCDEAGMLGYVQSEDCLAWAKKLEAAISANVNSYCLAPNSKWESHTVITEIPECYRTQHIRPSMGKISIYHSLLLFYKSGSS